MLLLLAVALEVCWLALRRIDNLRAEPVSTISTLLFATTPVYLVSVYWILRVRPRIQPSPLYLFILASAIGFRLTVWPLFPAFSDDVFRYHWEGKLQVTGCGNPYLVAPADAQCAAIRDETYRQVVLPGFRTIYGPAIELQQRAAYWLVRTLPPFSRVFWMKLPAAIFDLLTIGAVIFWLRKRGDPPEWVLLYAWCPLPVFEFWINGHNDAMLVFFLTSALATNSGTLLGLAAATKLWPAMLLPFLGWRRALAGAAAFGVLMLPYAGDVLWNLRYVSGFLGGWRNNDSLYGLLLAACGGDVYLAKYLTFAMLGAGVAYALWKRLSLEAAARLLIPLLLAISANVHPWYLTWLLPLLITARPSVPLLLWISLSPLYYVTLIDWFSLGEWRGVHPWRWAVYVPVYLSAAICAIRYVRNRISKAM